VATDLRGGDSFNSGFLRRFFLSSMVTKITKIGLRMPKFYHLALGGSGNYDSLCRDGKEPKIFIRVRFSVGPNLGSDSIRSCWVLVLSHL